MTVKLSVSVPDEVAAYLGTQPNTSAAVVAAVHAQMQSTQSRRERQRSAAVAYSEWATATGHDHLDELDRTSADISLGRAEW